MCKRYLTCLLVIVAACCIIPAKIYSQDIPKELYTANGIPDSLKEDANSVVRYSSDEVTINGPGKAVIKHHSIVTILNQKGDGEAFIRFYYDKKYDTYSDVDIHVYGADGVLIKKYHKSDMYDESASNYETIVTNARKLTLEHTVASYPTTIEVEYEEDLSSFISMDSWEIQDLEQSVQNATYTVLVKPEIAFRYKNENISLKPEKGTQGGFESYKWQVKNLVAIKKQDYTLRWTVLPGVLFGTSQFNCDGYPGDLSSWQNLGKWVYGLHADVCKLSPARVLEIRKMTDSIKTDKEKAKFLYEYLQQNTRYVSIQLGIGGWKPFDANFVDNKKYGDCKALANYMYALLDAVNIHAEWAVVRAGFNEPAADPAFPNNPFNHEILCIPFKNDTTWLDCTMTYREFGKPGPFTENRNALLITPDGGKLVNTPKSRADDNEFTSEVHLVLDSVGGAKAQVKILSTGEYREQYIGMASMKQDDQKQYLFDDLDIKQPSVFLLEYGKDKNYTKEMNINLEYDKFCDITVANKFFYHPHVFDLWNITPPIQEKRKANYYFDFPRIKTCVTTIDLPKGFEVETLPTNQQLKFTYGDYEVKYSYDAAKNQVISTAKFNLTNQVIPAAKYTEMQQYMDAIAKAQNKKLVIHRKT